MTSCDTIIPAAGCLVTGRVNLSRTRGAEHITSHFPVFGLRGEGLTLVIELHGRPATSGDLDSWLIQGGDRGWFYPEDYGDGELWRWRPGCECRGTTVTREPWGDVDGARLAWAECKAGYEKAQRGGAPVPAAG